MPRFYIRLDSDDQLEYVARVDDDEAELWNRNLGEWVPSPFMPAEIAGLGGDAWFEFNEPDLPAILEQLPV